MGIMVFFIMGHAGFISATVWVTISWGLSVEGVGVCYASSLQVTTRVTVNIIRTYSVGP